MTSLTPFVRFALRDLLLLTALAAAWWIDAEQRAVGATGPAPLAIGIVAGLLTTLVGFLCHEWGHLLGAIASGGVAHAPKRISSPFLFFFDVERSDRRAFLWMSYGGYIASAIALATLSIAVPWHSLSGRVALVTATLGVLATFLLEVPTTIRVARGGTLPKGGVFADERGHPRAVTDRNA